MPSSTKALVALKQERLLHRLNEPAFTPPQFYFGDRVQWTGEDANGVWASRTGQITGLHFTRLRTWQYQVRFDADPATDAESELDVSCAEWLLQLRQKPNRIEPHLPPPSEWLTTAQAAQVLGLSPEQLRRLRRKGLFKVGHHCRDTSFPNSGLSRWQWHVVRCGQALAVPPEKRGLPCK